ncbi:MAG TPA: hypothetical protein P5132_04705 [Bacteroidales bacterium]|nr:hypothetical protein [Bacteroidales bacterium]
MYNNSFKKYISFLFILTVIFTGCKKEDQSRLQANWSANDPIVIPYNIRKNETNLGNLAPNPSFETGKVYYEKSNVKSFDINGWKKVGQNIEWVNINNQLYTPGDVNSGNYAVRIKRDIADETELTGDGIISDYIKVIPGNYSLKMFLKFENICPNQSRLGTKMYDAINIRLLYYDKNKLEISGTQFNAFYQKKIDNSFKAYTLSNYEYIDKMEWGQIYGKSAGFPVFDGDMPDQARYVKIFIGLKGTGTMWIDDIEFRFTHQNFTLLERIKPYFDSSFTVYDQLFPKPKYINEKQPIEIYNPNAGFPIILIPENADIKLIKQAEILRDKIAELTSIKEKEKIQIMSSANGNSSDLAFVVSLGQSALYKKHAVYLPDSILSKYNGAYYIYQHENIQNTVFINALCNEGFQNAINTFCQLIDSKNGMYYAVNILDYPDFEQRAYFVESFIGTKEQFLNTIELLGSYKLYTYYLEDYGAQCNNFYPFNTFTDIQEYTSNYKLGVIYDLNKREGIKTDYILKSLQNNQINSALIKGNYYQSYNGNNPDHLEYFPVNNMHKPLHEEHFELINELNKKTSNHAANIEFMSPWSNLQQINMGHGEAEIYYRYLTSNIPEEINYYWTGDNYCALTIDYARIFRFKEISGKTPVFFDHSLLAKEYRFKSEITTNYYAGKIRTLSLFEPYNLDLYKGFIKDCENNKILVYTGELSEFRLIQLLTATDFLWNTKDYVPEKSLWVILNRLYGRDNALQLLIFNDAYYGLKEIGKKIELQGTQNKSIRIANNFEKELNKAYDALRNNLNNKELLNEIEQHKNEILNYYNDLLIDEN